MYTPFHGHTCQRRMQHGAISNTKTNRHLGKLLKRKWPHHPFPSYTFSQLTGSILMLINTNISLMKVFNTQLSRRKYSAPTYRCALGEACLTLFRSTHSLPPLTLKRMFQTFYGYSMPYLTFLSCFILDKIITKQPSKQNNLKFSLIEVFFLMYTCQTSHVEQPKITCSHMTVHSFPAPPF